MGDLSRPGVKACSKCGAPKIRAKGLCSACYQKQLKTARPSAPAKHSPSPNGAAPHPARTVGGSPTVRKVAEKIGPGIAIANGAAYKYLPGYRPDALNPTEIGVLSCALAEEIVSNRRLLEWYQKFGSSVTGPHTKLVAALGFIVAPRLARRGIIPQEVADEATLILFALVTAEPDELIADADEKAAEKPKADKPMTEEQALFAVDQVAELEPVRG